MIPSESTGEPCGFFPSLFGLYRAGKQKRPKLVCIIDTRTQIMYIYSNLFCSHEWVWADGSPCSGMREKKKKRTHVLSTLQTWYKSNFYTKRTLPR